MGKNKIGGALNNTTTIPLISFHSIVDEDIALIKHIILEYHNNKIFDFESIKDKKFIDIVGDIYRRKYKNPLYYLMKDSKYKKLLDDCYNEFINEHESEVLKHYTTTEMYNLVIDFKKSGDINPSILYYTDAQKALLDSFDELKDINKVSLKDALSKNIYSHYYLKYSSEIEPFIINTSNNIQEKIIYLSTTGINFDSKNEDIIINNDKIIELIKNKIRISIIDIYRTDIIGDYTL